MKVTRNIDTGDEKQTIRTISTKPKEHFEGRWKSGRLYPLYSVVVNNGTTFISQNAKMKEEPYVIYDADKKEFKAPDGWLIKEMSADSRVTALGGGGEGGVTPEEVEEMIKDKVDKVNGKGLSTNDYDDTEKNKVASAYQKPNNGIPKSDLAKAVQDVLDDADGAYKKPVTGIPFADLADGVQDSLSNADEAKAGLAGKQDTISDLQTIRTGAAAGATAYQKPSGGVPKSDLASTVQTSLGKADTAIQPAEFNELEEEVGTIRNGAYEEAWDGSSAPVVADIPAGVSVTYNSTSYTGTLAASASTVDKIYLVSDGNGNYDRYTTVEANGAYSWKKVGSTAIPLSNYATKTQVSQLQQKVTDKIDSFHEERTRQDYSEVLIDADGKMLESRDATGAKTEYTEVTMKKDFTVEKDLLVKESATVKEDLAVEGDADVDGEIKAGTSDIAGEKSNPVESAKYVKVIVDGGDKIVAGIEKDGTVYIPKLRAGNDVLSGKKWAVCGDSFTNGSASLPTIPGGLYAGKKQTYGWLIGHRCNMVIQHMAIGGRTIATPANLSVHNCFTDLASALNYSQIASDVDYITLYFGINDAGNAPSGESGDGETPVGEIPFGELTDTTPNTFCGAWNYVLPLLITNHPFAHIGILVSNGITSFGTTYSDATKALANKWGIPWIDLNGDKHTPFMIRSNNPIIPQSVKDARNVEQAVEWGVDNHPNAQAHLYESYFIEQFLRSI